MQRAFPEFLPLNAVRSQVVAFYEIKNTQKSILARALPRTSLGEFTLLPLVRMGIAAPPQEPHSRFGSSGLELRPFGPCSPVSPHFS